MTFARNETLYTGGKQWGPVSNWNPFMTGNYAMGTIGLCYETLFIYDPLSGQVHALAGVGRKPGATPRRTC